MPTCRGGGRGQGAGTGRRVGWGWGEARAAGRPLFRTWGEAAGGGRRRRRLCGAHARRRGRHGMRRVRVQVQAQASVARVQPQALPHLRLFTAGGAPAARGRHAWARGHGWRTAGAAASGVVPSGRSPRGQRAAAPRQLLRLQNALITGRGGAEGAAGGHAGCTRAAALAPSPSMGAAGGSRGRQQVAEAGRRQAAGRRRRLGARLYGKLGGE